MFRIASHRWLRRLAVLAALTVGTTSLGLQNAAAADPLKDESSLNFAPSDVSFYVAGLRMREVFDKVAASNAFAKLKSIPSIQFVWAMAMAQWENPQDPQVAMVKQMLADPANQQLIAMLTDAVSHEVFFYGDKNVGTTISMLNDINAAASAGQMEAMAAGEFENIQSYQITKVLEVLDQQGDKLKFPAILSGMKLSDPKPALDQLARLETLVQGVLQQQPDLQPRFSREQIGGGEFLTFKLDGSLIPWPMLLQDSEGVALQQMQKLAEKLSPLQLVISIGVRNNYLLVSIGEDNAHLGTLGDGALLYDRAEMAPIRNASDKPVTEIAFVSGEFVKQLATVERQMDQMVMMVKQFTPMFLGASPELQQELVADVEKFAEYVKQNISEPGDYSAFTYLTPEGYEAFSYNWSSESTVDASQNLSIVNHVGGDPLAFFAARGKSNPQQQDDFGTFLARVAYYAEQFSMQQFDETQLANYERLKADFLPLLQQFGAVTKEKLVPAFADNQSALVLDAKSTSAAWHLMMPPAEEELPMLEFGVVMGVSDAELVKEGFAEYFNIVQKILDKLHEASTGDMQDMFPNPIPPIQLAKPATKEVNGGTVYYYALPLQAGIDKQLAPNAGLGEKVMAASLLPRFTARLLADTPLNAAGPLADTNRPLGAAFHLNFAGLLDAISPWIDYGMTLSMGVSYEAQPGAGPMGNIPQQVHDVIDVLKCFQSVSGVTYKEGDAMVTHSQWRFEDLQ